MRRQQHVVTLVVWVLVARRRSSGSSCGRSLVWATASYTFTNRRLITRTRRHHPPRPRHPARPDQRRRLRDRPDRPDARLRHAGHHRRQHARPGAAATTSRTSRTTQRRLNELLLQRTATTAADMTESDSRPDPGPETSSARSSARSRSSTPHEVADARPASTIEEARRLWRALGFPEHGTETAFTQADAEARLDARSRSSTSGLIDFDLGGEPDPRGRADHGPARRLGGRHPGPAGRGARARRTRPPAAGSARPCGSSRSSTGRSSSC